MSKKRLKNQTIPYPADSLCPYLKDNTKANIILAVSDDPELREEAMRELEELLGEKYRFFEFDFTGVETGSLPRFCRAKAGNSPICVSVYGLESLKRINRKEYDRALHFLNAHREDIRDTKSSTVLWVSAQTCNDIFQYAPDFSDWSKSVTFDFPAEAGGLIKQARRYEEMLALDNLEKAKAEDFRKQLGFIEKKFKKTNSQRIINVFVASPGDVEEERYFVRKVCEELNNSAFLREYGLSFRLSGWEETIPSAGRPQGHINKMVRDCDVFVCIFHKRLGSPSGEEDSGTLEEFLLAYNSWKTIGRPHIFFYFKDVKINSPDEFNDPQLRKIFDLREKIEKEKLLLFDSFETPAIFREKFQKHMEGWIVENADFQEKTEERPSGLPPVLHIPDAYKKWLIDQCRYMDLRNLMEKGKAIRVELPEVFIPLYTDPSKKEKDFKEEKQEAMDIEKLVAEGESLLIQGQAGSGKTTLLKHLAYTVANNLNRFGLNGYLSVLVFLKDLQEQLKEKDLARANAQEAEKFLGDYLGPNGLDMDTVKNYCSSGKALFLFDGLDELEPKIRERVLKSLAGFRANNHNCKMVLSGRPHGIDNTALNHFGDRQAGIHALNMEQVEAFIKRWFAFIFHKGSKTGQRTAGEMIGEVRSHEGIGTLIDNPLMLTAICILYYDDRKLPDQRAELYKKFVDNLIHRRFEDPERVNNFLITLAFQVHNTGKRGFNKDFALKTWGKLYYPQGGEESGEDYEKRIEKNKPLLEKDFDQVEQNCGLLKLEKGQYDFWHLTFQEFLTARFIATKRFDYTKEIEGYWDNDWYREVIELLIGFLSLENQGWANKIVKEELDKDEKTSSRRWRLASQSLLDIHPDNRDAEVVRLARERLTSIFTLESDPKIKADAGEILGWLGDSRDLEEFVEIEGGNYELEGLKNTNIETFGMGKYPVTNQWFEKFIRAEGYKKGIAN